MKQDEIQQLQQKAEDVARQHSLKAGDLQKTIQQMETERERMTKQLQAAQEVVFSDSVDSMSGFKLLSSLRAQS